MTDLLTGIATLVLAGAASPEKPACVQSGGVFSIDPLIKTILVKRDGYIKDISFSDSTVFTRLAVGSGARPEPIKASDVQAGDLLCVGSTDAKGTAQQVSIVARGDFANAQRSYVMRWQRDSLFGVVNSFSTDRTSMVVSPALPWNDPLPVTVRLNDAVRFRTYPPTATRIGDAVDIRREEIQIGDRVYIRGHRDAADPDMMATLVQRGDVRALAGVILETDSLQSGVTFREYGSSRTLKVRLPSGDIYRTTDSLTNPMRVETRTGLTLVRVGLADLQPGDTVIVIGKTERDSDDVLGLGLITKFGSFGVAPDSSDEQVMWYLK